MKHADGYTDENSPFFAPFMQIL